HNQGHDSSTTHATVSDGNLIIRDKAHQTQDIATLSRDTDNAANVLSPIFDKEKAQQRLKQAQLIGEISAQMTEIASTEGKIIATKAAKAKLDHISEPDKAAARKKLVDSGNPHPTAADINKQVYDTAYTQALNDSGFGTGGTYQKALQAATAAIQGLAGNNLGQALAGGASPYLAGVIKELTTDPKTHQVDIATNTLAHAILGAVAAEVSGNNALSGAVGAASGELAAQVLIKQLYGDGAKVSELTEEQKQTISTLSTLAAGLAGGIAGDSSASALTGAQAGKNAADNNALGAAAGSDLGFWLSKTPDCDTTCKANIAKGIADGNLIVSAGGMAVAGGAQIVAATPEIAAMARAALEGCKAAPTICLNNAGIQVAEALTPGGVGAAGVIGVGKTAAEAAAAKTVAASTAKSINNAAHNAANYAGLKMDLKTTQAANEAVESLKTTGQLPKNYVTKSQAVNNGWKPGKALNNTTPGGQLGGDIFENSNNLLPSSPGRVWREADIGLDNTMSRGNQPGTRLLYSNDGLLYITTDHYETAISIGKWK
ncbi:hemagglutinin, partial [Photorhabdus luminescens]